MLFPNGFGYVWHVEDVGDQTLFMKTVKQRLIDCSNKDFPFLDGDGPHSPSYRVYISQLIRFARVYSNVDDFNNRNLFVTAKFLKRLSLQL